MEEEVLDAQLQNYFDLIYQQHTYYFHIIINKIWLIWKDGIINNIFIKNPDPSYRQDKFLYPPPNLVYTSYETNVHT